MSRGDRYGNNIIWATAWDFQQCGILTSVDSDEPVQPPFKLWNSKWCAVSSLTVIVYWSDKQRLWSDCAYAQAGLSLCWSHIPQCWKSHAAAHIEFGVNGLFMNMFRVIKRSSSGRRFFQAHRTHALTGTLFVYMDYRENAAVFNPYKSSAVFVGHSQKYSVSLWL